MIIKRWLNSKNASKTLLIGRKWTFSYMIMGPLFVSLLLWVEVFCFSLFQLFGILQLYNLLLASNFLVCQLLHCVAWYFMRLFLYCYEPSFERRLTRLSGMKGEIVNFNINLNFSPKMCILSQWHQRSVNFCLGFGHLTILKLTKKIEVWLCTGGLRRTCTMASVLLTAYSVLNTE